ncbi:hypothetical protein ABT025_20395 [Streptomyces sp. NPDC002809]|uniref:hypothetical protein n=1 Tax=Streptomyces sp. NPDC002809 TaxID=3154433 RepID=UPI0033301D01
MSRTTRRRILAVLPAALLLALVPGSASARLLTLLSALLLAPVLGQPAPASAAEGRPYSNPAKA